MSIRSRLARGDTRETVAEVYSMTLQELEDFLNPPRPEPVKPAAKPAAKKKVAAKKKSAAKK
jgi:hypothetical protein